MKVRGSDPFILMDDRQIDDKNNLDNIIRDQEPSRFKPEKEEDLIKSLNQNPLEVDDPEKEPEGEAPEGDENPEDLNKDDFKIKIEGNISPILAKKWKEEGRIPEDFEIKDDMTEDDLDTAVYTHIKQSGYTKLRTEVLEDIIESEGLTPETIQAAKRIFGAVPDENIKKENFYRGVASYQLDPESDEYENDVKRLGIMYHIDKGFSEEKAAKYVDRDIEEDADGSIQEYQNYFKGKALELKNYNEALQQRNIKETSDKKRKEIELFDSLLNKGEIQGVKYTKEQMTQVRKAMQEKTEVIVDSEGRQRLVTLEHKKILESRFDPEKAFQARVNFILGYSPAEAAKDATIRAKTSLAGELNKIVTVERRDIRGSKTNVTKQQSAIQPHEKEIF